VQNELKIQCNYSFRVVIKHSFTTSPIAYVPAEIEADIRQFNTVSLPRCPVETGE